MRTFILSILLVLTPCAVQAKTLVFDLGAGDGVELRDVDIEEAGAVHDGGRTGTTIETTAGKKLFRVIVTADVVVSATELNARRAYFDRFQYLDSRRDHHGTRHKYRIRDVVRLPINVVDGGTVDMRVLFDPTIPALTVEGLDGRPQPIDRMAKMQDNQHFGIAPPPFTGSISSSPGSVCLEERPSEGSPMIVECVRWGSR